MKCLRDGELQQYLSESQADERRELVESHLATCARCRSALDRLTATNVRVDDLLSSLVPEDTAASPAVALANARRRAAAPSLRRISRPWWAIGAAACGGLVVFGVWQQTRLATTDTRPVHATTVDLASADDPLPGINAFLPLGTGGPVQMGIVIRVTLPASAMAAFGVTNSGATQADLLVGDDGLAHAIRLVR